MQQGVFTKKRGNIATIPSLAGPVNNIHDDYTYEYHMLGMCSYGKVKCFIVQVPMQPHCLYG